MHPTPQYTLEAVSTKIAPVTVCKQQTKYIKFPCGYEWKLWDEI